MQRRLEARSSGDNKKINVKQLMYFDGYRERRKRPPKRMAGKMRERTKSPGPAAVWAGSTVTSTCQDTQLLDAVYVLQYVVSKLRSHLVGSKGGEELRVLGQGIELVPVAIDIDGKELGAVSGEGDLHQTHGLR
jgi:hypothetical protein